MPRIITFNDMMEMIARNLREFGYPDCTATMIREVYDAWDRGDEPPLPHGVIGQFAKRDFEENAEPLRRRRQDEKEGARDA